MKQEQMWKFVGQDRAEALQRVLDVLECEVAAASKLAYAMFQALDHADRGPVAPDTAKTMLSLLESMLDDALETAYANEERINDPKAPHPAPAQQA